jgi:hypothetical protein
VSKQIGLCYGYLDADVIEITQFYGGIHRGVRLQLRQNGKWIEVGLGQAEELGNMITKWAEAQTKEEY